MHDLPMNSAHDNHAAGSSGQQVHTDLAALRQIVCGVLRLLGVLASLVVRLPRGIVHLQVCHRHF
jgi:hypothetical protein